MPRSILRSVLRGVQDDEVVVPILRNYLFNPKIPAFTVPLERFEERGDDGWFHPSTHPGWTERQLYHYVMACDGRGSLIYEPRDPTVNLAALQGNFWHACMQTCGLDAGLFVVKTPGGKTPHDKVEMYVEDPVCRSRGSMDGVVSSLLIPEEVEEGFELKTMVYAKLRGCPQGGVRDVYKIGWFIEKCPDYYLQVQDYLRMSGLPAVRVMIMALEYPFTMVEIRVPFNRAVADQIAQRYLRVRQAYADGVPPTACCSPRSAEAKVCVARSICEIGRFL